MQKFTVEATDQDGRPIRREVDASSMGEAERLLRAQGLTVRAISVEEDSPASDPQTPGPRPAGPEDVVWSGSPSQWLNAGWFASCILVVPIPIAIWKYIALRNTAYLLTTQRIKLEEGVLSKRYDQVELYRVKDTILTRTFLQRLLGLGSIKMITSDPSQPELFFPSIADSERVREMIRQNVERMRRLRGVRELDVAEESMSQSLHGSA